MQETNRRSEALQFLEAFSTNSVKTFLQKFLIGNYTDAICTYHPNAESLNRNSIFEKNSDLIQSIFAQIEALEGNEYALFDLFHRLSRNNPQRDPLWFPEFIDAYQNYKHRLKLENRYKQLLPFLKGSTYCDVGCGGGDLVAYLLNNHPQFEKAAGIDIMDWRSENVRDMIDFQMLDFTQPETSSREEYDTLTCLAVLHHTGSQTEQLEVFLKNVKTAMKKGGRLIIEEDVIIPHEDQNLSPGIEKQLQSLTQSQSFLQEFLDFPADIQKKIIISIDFLANCLSVGVPDMPFPCGFQTLGQWIEIFDKTDLKLMEVRIQGFVQNNFNQSFHVFFILEN